MAFDYEQVGFRARDKFDALAVIIQISILQMLFWIILGLLSLLLMSASDMTSVRHGIFMFGLHRLISPWTSVGRLTALVFVATALMMGRCFPIFVQRSRQCWDYATTLYLVHLAVDFLVNGPHFEWSCSVVLFASWLITWRTGSSFCQDKELQPISLIPLQGDFILDV